MRIYSEPGHGTTVKLYLPRAQASDDRPQLDVAAEMPRGRGDPVLVVGDSPKVRALTEQLLTDLGYRVLICAGEAG